MFSPPAREVVPAPRRGVTRRDSESSGTTLLGSSLAGRSYKNLYTEERDPMPDKPLIWLGSSRRDLGARSLLSHDGWPVFSCGVFSWEWIRTTGSRCRRSDRAFVRPGFKSPVHTLCFTWRRERRRSTSLHAFEKKTQKTSGHDLRIGRDRFRALGKLRQQHGKEERR